MSIPRETSKELFVTVENDAVVVAISPPILDAVIVNGVAPEPNADTIMLTSYDPEGNTLFLRTQDGRQFTVNNAVEVAP